MGALRGVRAAAGCAPPCCRRRRHLRAGSGCCGVEPAAGCAKGRHSCVLHCAAGPGRRWGEAQRARALSHRGRGCPSRPPARLCACKGVARCLPGAEIGCRGPVQSAGEANQVSQFAMRADPIAPTPRSSSRRCLGGWRRAPGLALRCPAVPTADLLAKYFREPRQPSGGARAADDRPDFVSEVFTQPHTAPAPITQAGGLESRQTLKLSSPAHPLLITDSFHPPAAPQARRRPAEAGQLHHHFDRAASGRSSGTGGSMVSGALPPRGRARWAVLGAAAA